MINRSTFRVLDTVIATCLNSIFLKNRLIDICFSLSKSVNYVSDQGSNASGPMVCKLFLKSQLTSQTVPSSASPVC